MGIFFETEARKAERLEKEKKAQARNVALLAEELSSKESQLSAQCAALWEKAKMQLSSGQKSAAAMTLKHFKSKQLEMKRYSRLNFLVQNKLSSLQSAADMQNAAEALKEFAQSAAIDIDQLEADLDKLEECAADIRDMQKSIDRSLERANSSFDREFNSISQEDDPLLKSLQESLFPEAQKPQAAPQTAPAPDKITSENVDEALKKMLDVQ